jgi:hypothetical protein
VHVTLSLGIPIGNFRTCRHIAISTDIPYNPIIRKIDFPVN